MLSEREIEEIRARHEAATLGEWIVSADGRIPVRIHTKTNDLKIGGKNFPGTKIIAEMVWANADADFIVHAREDISALLSDRAELQAKVEKLTKRNTTLKKRERQVEEEV